NDRFHAVHDAASGGWPKPAQGIKRCQCTSFRAPLKSLAEKQKSENQQDRVKVDLAIGAWPYSRECGVGKCHSGTQADQRIHVCCAMAQPARGTHVNSAPCPGHQYSRKREKYPTQNVSWNLVEPGQ